MSLPHPRTPAHDELDPIDPRRETFLAAMAQIWDTARAQSRAQMTHAAAMITHKLGGTLILRAESTVSRRTVPEAGYVSEGFGFTDSGIGR